MKSAVTQPSLSATRRDQPPADANARNFTLWFMLALAAGLVAAVVIAPLAAALVGAASWRVPFPRIFDRVVMVTLAAAMIAFVRPLGLLDLLRDGFADFRRAPFMILCGFALATLTVGVLFVTAFELNGSPIGPIAARAARYIVAAAAIALIEEGFFRAILLGGILRISAVPPRLSPVRRSTRSPISCEPLPASI